MTQTELGLAAFSTRCLAVRQGAAASSKIRLCLVGCGYEVVGGADYFHGKVDKVAAKHKLGPGLTFTGLQCAQKMMSAGELFRSKESMETNLPGLHA